jgi:CRP-like cAMP-binding protein
MLKASSWAASLTQNELAKVMAGIAEREVPAGTLFCRKGDHVDCWFGVMEGLMKISNDCVNGKTATLTGVSPGGWFGEGSMLKNEPRRYDAVALRKSRVACMRRETFVWLLDNSIAFNRFLLVQLNERLGMMIGLLESERLLDVDTRVARCLA